MTNDYDKNYQYAESFMMSVIERLSYAETDNNITRLLFYHWYPKGIGNFANGNHRFENFRKNYSLSLNYFFQLSSQQGMEWSDLLLNKIKSMSCALEQFKIIQQYILMGDWEKVREFHDKNFYYRFNDARTDGQIHKDDFFIWFVWEAIEMLEDYLNRMDPTGKEQLNDTDRF